MQDFPGNSEPVSYRPNDAKSSSNSKGALPNVVKTYAGNLRMFVVSSSVCHWQAFRA
jgi:hypothetical protein